MLLFLLMDDSCTCACARGRLVTAHIMTATNLQEPTSGFVFVPLFWSYGTGKPSKRVKKPNISGR